MATLEPRTVPRRDLVLLPAIAVLTLLLIAGMSEALARHFYPEDVTDRCVVHDSVLYLRFKANCVSHSKAAEGPPVENRYNECGSRSRFPCAKPVGTLRIGVFGNSISQGYLIPYEQSYGAMVRASLQRTCSRPVDVQNVARQTYDWGKSNLDLDEVLALQPDVVVTSVIPLDLETDPDRQAPAANKSTASLLSRLSQVTSSSRAVLVAKNLYYKNGRNFVDLYLHYGEKANFLRPPFSTFWSERLKRYDELLDEMARKAAAHQVPLLLVYVPQQAQAALMHMPPIQDVDPRAFTRALAALARKHGIFFVDASEAFGRADNPSDLYYRTDGHPGPGGQAVIADVVAREMRAIPGGPFASCRRAS